MRTLLPLSTICFDELCLGCIRKCRSLHRTRSRRRICPASNKELRATLGNSLNVDQCVKEQNEALEQDKKDWAPYPIAALRSAEGLSQKTRPWKAISLGASFYADLTYQSCIPLIL